MPKPRTGIRAMISGLVTTAPQPFAKEARTRQLPQPQELRAARSAAARDG